MSVDQYNNVTVTLSEDDYWRLRHALVVASQHHEKARDKCKGNNQRSTDTILQHEHIMRRLEDVEEKLKAAAAPDVAEPARDLNNTIAQEGCDRCVCGCKYWENDRCIDCGTHINQVPQEVRQP
jgi:hypothetical protein